METTTTTMTTPEDTRITRYLADEMTPAERSAFEAELATSAELRAQLKQAREIVALLRSGFERESAAPSPAAAIAPPPRRPRILLPTAIAASILALAAGAVLLRSRDRTVEVSQKTEPSRLEVADREKRSFKPDAVAPPPTTPSRQPESTRLTDELVKAKDVKKLPTLGAGSAPGPGPAPVGSAASATPVPAQSAQRGAMAERQFSQNLDYRFHSGDRSDVAKKMAAKTELYSRSGVAQADKLSASSARGWYAEREALGDAPADSFRVQNEPSNTESYDRIADNPFMDVPGNPLSTFSIDVDTASYSNLRRFILSGQRPPKDSVRIEELVNYFPYDYAPPATLDKNKSEPAAPFAAHVEVAGCPWNESHRLVRVGIKGMEVREEQRPPANLVFLIDVSGSMQPANKLPLLKQSMRMLAERLAPKDRVAIAVYAGSSGLVLPSTPVGGASRDEVQRVWKEKYAPQLIVVDGKPTNEKAVRDAFEEEMSRISSSTGRTAILAALDKLEAGGSTNGAQGIELAYQTAVQNFIPGGVNRVILCTDGDFNVGVTNQGDLTRLIEEKAKTGVFLSVLGFGMGNLKDSTMEKLADKGNGNYAYVDTLTEAKKVLVEQMNSTLVTIAKDVKIQVEFNPATVGSYRLIGYENRLLAKEDFNDDKKDAGEIGAGHTVTALYEVVPAGVKDPATSQPSVDPLRYQPATTTPPVGMMKPPGNLLSEMLTLKLRYKAPEGDKSTLMETPVTDAGAPFAKASTDFKFASAVAAYGMLLRESPHKGNATFAAVEEWAQEGVGPDPSGYRHEFLDLIKKTRALPPAQ